MPAHFPLPAFHFRLSFKKLPGDTGVDSQFVSVTGLKGTIISVDEEGLSLKKPVIQFQPVILQRAVYATKRSPLRNWVFRSLANPGSLMIKEVLIEILNEDQRATMLFKMLNVTAAGWELGELNAGKNELLMEQITLNYKSITQSEV
jgi:phage tail-like protein